MNKIQIYVMPFMQVICLAFLLWLTIQPVEVRWADADVVLCWSLPFIGIIGIMMLLLSKGKCHLTIVDGLVSIWTIYYIGRAWIGSEYPCATEWLQVIEVIALYVVLRMVFHNTKIPAWVLSAGIMIFGFYEAFVGVGQLISGQGRHHIFALTGTFMNPGPYSVYLMMAAVLAICFKSPNMERNQSGLLERINDIIKNPKVNLKYLSEKIPVMIRQAAPFGGWGALLLLPATWSRSAFVGFGLCALWIFRKRYWKYRWTVWGSLVVLAVGFYFLKQGSADGRTVTWMASLTSWLHEPWLGVGIGGFRHACAEGIAEMWNANPDSNIFDSAGVTDYAYNSLLKVLVEQGIVGALLWIAITIIAMWRLYKVSEPLFMAMLSLLIFSMFSYPFELLPYKIIVVIVFAWSESKNSESLNLNVGKTLCTIVCLFTIAFSWFLKGDVCNRLEQDKGANLFSGMQNTAFLTDYYELLPYETDNSQFLFDFAKTLRSEKRYSDSNAILRQATLVSADPMFYIIMGNNYRDEQFYDLAEEAYRKAYAIMPNRLYPLYQLMMMYADMGERDKAYEMAKVVRSSEVKIESKATQQMRQKADSIYHNDDMILHPEKYVNKKIKR